MPKLRTYYEILDVAINADEAAIRRAYRKAVAAHHPDRDNYSERSQKRIRELNTARETLLNEKRRAKYDKQLKKMGIIPDGPVEDIESVKKTGSSDSDITNYATPPETHWRTQEQPTSTGSSTEFEEYNPTPEPQNWDTASDFSSRQSFDNQAFKTKTGTFVKNPIRRKRKKLGKPFLLLVSLPLGGISGISVAILILWLGFQMDPLGLFSYESASISNISETSQNAGNFPTGRESASKKTIKLDDLVESRETPDEPAAELQKTSASKARKIAIENNAFSLKGHRGKIWSVAFSPDGNEVISAAQDRTVKIWDSETGLAKLSLSVPRAAYSAAFSPDGNSVVVGSTGSIKIFDLRGDLMNPKSGAHASWVTCVAFSPDGKSIVSGGGETVKIWDAQTGYELVTIKARSHVFDVAYGPRGKKIACAAGNNVFLFDSLSGRELSSLPSGGSCLAFSPDGTELAIGEVKDKGDCRIKILHAESWKEKLTLSGHNFRVTSIAYSLDGNSIVSGSADKTVRIWDASTGEQLETLERHVDSLKSVSYHPSGNKIVSGGEDSKIFIWDLAPQPIPEGSSTQFLSMKRELEVKKHLDVGDFNSALLLEPKSPQALSMKKESIAKALLEGNFQKALLLDPNNDEALAMKRAFPVENALAEGDFQKALLLDPNNAQAIGMKQASDISNALAEGDFQKALLIEPGNLKAREMKKEFTRRKIENVVVTIKELPSGYSNVALSPDGRTIACAGENNTVRLMDAKTGRVKRSLTGHAGIVTSVAFSPVGTTFASGSKDKTLIIWDAKTGRTKGRINVGLEFYNIAFSPDGKSIALAGSQTVSVLNAKTGRKVDLSKQGDSGNYNVAWNPDGNSLICSNTQQILRIWDIKKGVERSSPNGFSGLSVAFSPDRKSIIAASPENKLEIWDTETGEKKQILTGHTRTVWCIAFSPDGKRIVSAGDDQLVRIWDLNTGLEDIALNGHKGRITSIAFSPDGNSVVSGSRDSTIKIWNLKAAEQFDAERKDGPVEESSPASKPDPETIKSLPKSFNSATAKKHQKAWAAKLKLPVKFENSIGMEFVLITPGSFVLNDLKPWKKNASTLQGKFFRGTERSIDQPFYISTTEVTQSAYELLLKRNPSKLKGRNLPVEQVSFQDCVKFCKLLSDLEDEQYTLPTEEQWEFSALSGQSNPLFWRTSEALLNNYAWHRGNSGIKTREVATKRPNQFGLFDTLGNVSEWCIADGNRNGSSRVYKGNASFNSPDVFPFQPGARQATKDAPYYTIGFRVIRQLPKNVLKELE